MARYENTASGFTAARNISSTQLSATGGASGDAFDFAFAQFNQTPMSVGVSGSYGTNNYVYNLLGGRQSRVGWGNTNKLTPSGNIAMRTYLFYPGVTNGAYFSFFDQQSSMSLSLGLTNGALHINRNGTVVTGTGAMPAGSYWTRWEWKVNHSAATMDAVVYDLNNNVLSSIAVTNMQGGAHLAYGIMILAPGTGSTAVSFDNFVFDNDTTNFIGPYGAVPKTKVEASANAAFAIRNRLSFSKTSTYTVRVTTSKSITSPFGVRTITGTNINALYDVLETVISQVAKSADVGWGVRNTLVNSQGIEFAARYLATSTQDTTYAVKSSVVTNKSVRFGVLQGVVTQEDIAWAIRIAVPTEVLVEWNVRQVGKVLVDVVSEWAVSQRLDTSVDARWRVTLTDDLTQIVLDMYMLDGKLYVSMNELKAQVSTSNMAATVKVR